MVTDIIVLFYIFLTYFKGYLSFILAPLWVILQARILEWVVMPFSRGLSQPGDWTQVSYIAGRFFTVWTTKEAHSRKCTIFS